MIITSIVTHGSPHADEIAAEWMLRRFDKGEQKYPGIKNAARMQMHSCVFPQGKTYKDYPERLFIGCGFSPFDEHSLGEGLGDLECTATLVAKHLNIYHDSALQKILHDVLVEDRYGMQDPREIAYVIKLLHRTAPESDPNNTHTDKVVKWAMTAFDAIYLWQQEMRKGCANKAEWKTIRSGQEWQKPVTLESAKGLVEKAFPGKADEWHRVGKQAFDLRNKRREQAIKDFSRHALIQEIYLPQGRRGKLAFIKTESDQMRVAAKQANVSILIQRNSQGNVQIFCTEPDLDLREVAHLCRYREQERRGKLVVTDPKKLESVGMLEEVPYWHLMDTASSDNKDTLLNGSITASMVDPTILADDEIIKLVKIGINPANFEKERFRMCRIEVCDPRCPWFNWKLHRCRKVRHEDRRKAEGIRKNLKGPKPIIREDPAILALFEAADAEIALERLVH
jgi:hypothetical protein